VKDRRINIPELNRQIIEGIKTRDRLAEIKRLLSSDSLAMSAMKLQEKARVRAKLEIEQIWQMLKCEMISEPKQQHLLSSKFDEWQKIIPDVYIWLVTPGEDGMSEAQKIRYKVMPPRPRIAEYHTKR
jgi:hypothetical protein